MTKKKSALFVVNKWTEQENTASQLMSVVIWQQAFCMIRIFLGLIHFIRTFHISRLILFL